MTDDLHPETIAIRAGRRPGQTELAPAIVASAAFVTPDLETAHRLAMSSTADEFYSRFGNPSVSAFEAAMAELEHAEAARAYGSGMGAVTAAVLGIAGAGDHIVTQRQLYSGTQLVFAALCPRLGIEVTFVDGTDPDAWQAAIRPGKTVLCFAETPANPRLDLVDLDRLGEIAGPITVVDSTFATPVGQRPLDHGVDLVLHSATKAIGGHNDASLGVLAGSRELIDWVRAFSVLQGANASPFDAVGGLRGLRTLAVRFERQSQTAAVLAERLDADPRAAEVRHPSLRSFPQYELAQRQMSLPGGLLTFDVAAGGAAAAATCEAVEIMQLATSLGGPETLITHPASTTHAGLTPEELADSGISAATIRVSVGLEHVEDLWNDIDRALGMSA